MNKVHSILRKALKAVLWLTIVIVLIFVIMVALIQVPGIQNRIVNYATSFVSNKTHTSVKIKHLRIRFPKSVVIEGLYLEDVQKDTLLYAGKVNINIALLDLFSQKISISSFKLEDVNLNLYNTSTDSLLNLNFLLTAFSDTTRQTKLKPQSPSKWTFNINKVSLKNIRFHFNDEFGGININAVLGSLNLKMDEIDFRKSIYGIDELLVEDLNGNVLIKKHANAEHKKSAKILPQITAKQIQINNLGFSYGDSINKQSIVVAINRFVLTDGSAGLNDLKIKAKGLILNGNSFAIELGDKPEKANVFDANHLKYNHLTLEATDLLYSPDTLEASIKKFSATDRNGFSVIQFETDFIMDQHSITAKNLKAQTASSLIVADLHVQYSSLKSLKDSIPYLMMNLNLEEVSIKNADILYFSPQLARQSFFNNKTTITFISGIITGTVNNLNGEKLVIRTLDRTSIKTNFSIIGLPVFETAYFDLPNLEINTSKRDVLMMTGSSIPQSIELPEKIEMQIAFKGRVKAFESTVGMNSSYGSANLFATIDKNENFRSTVSIKSFDLGGLLKDTAMFGPVTLTARADGQGLDKNTIRAKIDIAVSQFYLNQYTYHNLALDGNINGQQFEGNINLNDDNAIFDFDGLVNISPDHEKYKFRLNVEGADLQKLNIIKDDIRIALVAEADLAGGAVNELNGRAGISNLIVAKGEKVYVLDSLLFVSINEPDKSVLNFSSALIGVRYSGTISPADLPTELNHFINDYFPFSDSNLTKKKSGLSNFNFEIQLHNHPLLSQVLLPQLTEFEPGIIQGSFDSEKSELKLNATMKKIVYGTTEIRDFLLDVNSDPATLNYKISVSRISNTQIKLDNFLLDGKLAENTLFANVSSIEDDQNKKLLIRSQITRNNNNYRLILDPSDFFLMNKRWDIAADNYIKFGQEGILIHHFFINNAESQINIASVNDKFNDDLNVEIKNFKLDDISRIIEKDTSLVKGIVDGNVLLKRVNNTYGIIADAKISNLEFREIPIGDLSVKASNPTTERFDIEVNLSGTENNLTANGYYIPDGGDQSMNIKTMIHSLSMKTVEAFSMGQLTETSGYISGNLLILGASSSPEITGELVFNDAFFNAAVFNNRMELKHETIQLKKEGIYFKSFTLSDADKHTAIIDGSIQMKQFKDYIFDLQVNTKDFLLFNTTAKNNKLFFGRMVIDSRIDVNGPMTFPVVDAKIKLKEGSNFTFIVPEDKLSTDKGEDVVEFTDTLKLNSILFKDGIDERQKSGFSGLEISSIIEVDKEATLRLLLDPASTDSLVVKGQAALSFAMDRSGKMSLTGAYNLDEGSYLVSLQSVIKRKFEINPGSTIIWNGDPLDAEISINATYTVRASPIDLVADQMSGLSEIDKGAYKQRHLFWVLLKLRGEILHPEISFEIQLPPENKGILGGAVNAKLMMLNEDPSALNKQVFALLVLGRFIQENPLQSDANRGASTVVRSTVGKFLSAQLNQLSSKIVPGVELNFDIQSYDDYSNGQAEGRTEVEIGVKKQLFNERVTVEIGGTVDVEGEKAQQNTANDITSDVTIEYKLTKDGRYRLKGFRNYQYEGALEGQIIETGVGVSYVRDFNKWKELFKAPKKAKLNQQEKQ